MFNTSETLSLTPSIAELNPHIDPETLEWLLMNSSVEFIMDVDPLDLQEFGVMGPI